MQYTIAADRGDAGIRLDLVVRRHMIGATTATRTQVQHWIVDGRVRVNGTIVRRVATRTMSGDIVTVTPPAAAARQMMEAEPVALDLLHEDADLMVVNKPAGVVVHPTYRHRTKTIMNGLLWHGRDWPQGNRPSIVGRLDKETSGLVVVAKRASVHAALQKTLASHASEKDYLAIVFGQMPQEPVLIDLALGRDPDDRRRVVTTRDGVQAKTHVQRLAEDVDDAGVLSLAQCRLLTGRMHQIRVHLAAAGWPLAGDAKYGRPYADLDRQALHAWRVRFAHPRTGASLDVEAPVPADMARVIAARFSGPARRPFSL